MLSIDYPIISSLPINKRISRWIGILCAALNAPSAERRRMETEFQSLIQRYGTVISGVCFSYANDADDLKDLRQDILINIWKGLGTFRGDSSPSTWIYRVALNTCVSTVRKRSRRPMTLPLESAMDKSESSDQMTLERIEHLHTSISTLSPIDKAIVTMWLDERKYEEIADVVGISRNNVAVRINRIKQKLGSLMKEWAPTP